MKINKAMLIIARWRLFVLCHYFGLLSKWDMINLAEQTGDLLEEIKRKGETQ